MDLLTGLYAFIVVIASVMIASQVIKSLTGEDD